MNNIAAAFINAKKQFAPALKKSLNPHYRSQYADLATCIEAVDDSFLNNGIVMYQETFQDDSGVTVETVLLHESGEVIRCGKLHVPAAKLDPPGYGSALTYARRYSLMAACGIAAEDDDGRSAEKKDEAPEPSKEEIEEAVKILRAASVKGMKEFTKSVNEIQSAIKAKMDPNLKKELAAKAREIDAAAEDVKAEIAAREQAIGNSANEVKA